MPQDKPDWRDLYPGLARGGDDSDTVGDWFERKHQKGFERASSIASLGEDIEEAGPILSSFDRPIVGAAPTAGVPPLVMQLGSTMVGTLLKGLGGGLAATVHGGDLLTDKLTKTEEEIPNQARLSTRLSKDEMERLPKHLQGQRMARGFSGSLVGGLKFQHWNDTAMDLYGVPYEELNPYDKAQVIAGSMVGFLVSFRTGAALTKAGLAKVGAKMPLPMAKFMTKLSRVQRGGKPLTDSQIQKIAMDEAVEFVWDIGTGIRDQQSLASSKGFTGLDTLNPLNWSFAESSVMAGGAFGISGLTIGKAAKGVYRSNQKYLDDFIRNNNILPGTDIAGKVKAADGINWHIRGDPETVVDPPSEYDISRFIISTMDDKEVQTKAFGVAAPGPPPAELRPVYTMPTRNVVEDVFGWSGIDASKSASRISVWMDRAAKRTDRVFSGSGIYNRQTLQEEITHEMATVMDETRPLIERERAFAEAKVAYAAIKSQEVGATKPGMPGQYLMPRADNIEATALELADKVRTTGEQKDVVLAALESGKASNRFYSVQDVGLISERVDELLEPYGMLGRVPPKGVLNDWANMDPTNMSFGMTRLTERFRGLHWAIDGSGTRVMVRTSKDGPLEAARVVAKPIDNTVKVRRFEDGVSVTVDLNDVVLAPEAGQYIRSGKRVGLVNSSYDTQGFVTADWNDGLTHAIRMEEIDEIGHNPPSLERLQDLFKNNDNDTMASWLRAEGIHDLNPEAQEAFLHQIRSGVGTVDAGQLEVGTKVVNSQVGSTIPARVIDIDEERGLAMVHYEAAGIPDEVVPVGHLELIDNMEAIGRGLTEAEALKREEALNALRSFARDEARQFGADVDIPARLDLVDTGTVDARTGDPIKKAIRADAHEGYRQYATEALEGYLNRGAQGLPPDIAADPSMTKAVVDRANQIRSGRRWKYLAGKVNEYSRPRFGTFTPGQKPLGEKSHIAFTTMRAEDFKTMRKASEAGAGGPFLPEETYFTVFPEAPKNPSDILVAVELPGGGRIVEDPGLDDAFGILRGTGSPAKLADNTIYGAGYRVAPEVLDEARFFKVPESLSKQIPGLKRAIQHRLKDPNLDPEEALTLARKLTDLSVDPLAPNTLRALDKTERIYREYHKALLDGDHGRAARLETELNTGKLEVQHTLVRNHAAEGVDQGRLIRESMLENPQTAEYVDLLRRATSGNDREAAEGFIEMVRRWPTVPVDTHHPNPLTFWHQDVPGWSYRLTPYVTEEGSRQFDLKLLNPEGQAVQQVRVGAQAIKEVTLPRSEIRALVRAQRAGETIDGAWIAAARRRAIEKARNVEDRFWTADPKTGGQVPFKILDKDEFQVKVNIRGEDVWIPRSKGRIKKTAAYAPETVQLRESVWLSEDDAVRMLFDQIDADNFGRVPHTDSLREWIWEGGDPLMHASIMRTGDNKFATVVMHAPDQLDKAAVDRLYRVKEQLNWDTEEAAEEYLKSLGASNTFDSRHVVGMEGEKLRSLQQALFRETDPLVTPDTEITKKLITDTYPPILRLVSLFARKNRGRIPDVVRARAQQWIEHAKPFDSMAGHVDELDGMLTQQAKSYDSKAMAMARRAAILEDISDPGNLKAAIEEARRESIRDNWLHTLGRTRDDRSYVQWTQAGRHSIGEIRNTRQQYGYLAGWDAEDLVADVVRLGPNGEEETLTVPLSKLDPWETEDQAAWRRLVRDSTDPIRSDRPDPVLTKDDLRTFLPPGERMPRTPSEFDATFRRTGKALLTNALEEGKLPTTEHGRRAMRDFMQLWSEARRRGIDLERPSAIQDNQVLGAPLEELRKKSPEVWNELLDAFHMFHMKRLRADDSPIRRRVARLVASVYTGRGFQGKSGQKFRERLVNRAKLQGVEGVSDVELAERMVPDLLTNDEWWELDDLDKMRGFLNLPWTDDPQGFLGSQLKFVKGTELSPIEFSKFWHKYYSLPYAIARQQPTLKWTFSRLAQEIMRETAVMKGHNQTLVRIYKEKVAPEFFLRHGPQRWMEKGKKKILDRQHLIGEIMQGPKKDTPEAIKAWHDLRKANPELEGAANELADMLEELKIRHATFAEETGWGFEPVVAVKGKVSPANQKAIANELGGHSAARRQALKVIEDLENGDLPVFMLTRRKPLTTPPRNPAQVKFFGQMLREYDTLADIPEKVLNSSAWQPWMTERFDFWQRWGINNYFPYVTKGRLMVNLRDKKSGIVYSIANADDGHAVQESVRGYLKYVKEQGAIRIGTEEVGIDDLLDPNKFEATYVWQEMEVDDMWQQFQQAFPSERQWREFVASNTSDLIKGREISVKLEDLIGYPDRARPTPPGIPSMQRRLLARRDNFDNLFRDLQIYAARVERAEQKFRMHKIFEQARELDPAISRAYGVHSLDHPSNERLSQWLTGYRDEVLYGGSKEKTVLTRGLEEMVWAMNLPNRVRQAFWRKFTRPDYNWRKDPEFVKEWNIDSKLREAVNFVTTMGAVTKLGVSMLAAGVNLMQPFFFATSRVGFKNLAKGIGDALNFWKNQSKRVPATFKSSSGAAADLANFAKEFGMGVDGGIGFAGVELMGSLGRNPDFGDLHLSGKVFDGTQLAAMYMFNTAERINRLSTLFAARRLGLEKLGKDTSVEALKDFAVDIVGGTQFFYFDEALPKLLSGPLGRTLGQFKPFTWGALRWGGDMLSAIRHPTRTWNGIPGYQIALTQAAVTGLGGYTYISNHPMALPIKSAWDAVNMLPGTESLWNTEEIDSRVMSHLDANAAINARAIGDATSWTGVNWSWKKKYSDMVGWQEAVKGFLAYGVGGALFNVDIGPRVGLAGMEIRNLTNFAVGPYVGDVGTYAAGSLDYLLNKPGGFPVGQAAGEAALELARRATPLGRVPYAGLVLNHIGRQVMESPAFNNGEPAMFAWGVPAGTLADALGYKDEDPRETRLRRAASYTQANPLGKRALQSFWPVVVKQVAEAYQAAHEANETGRLHSKGTLIKDRGGNAFLLEDDRSPFEWAIWKGLGFMTTEERGQLLAAQAAESAIEAAGSHDRAYRTALDKAFAEALSIPGGSNTRVPGYLRELIQYGRIHGLLQNESEAWRRGAEVAKSRMAKALRSSSVKNEIISRDVLEGALRSLDMGNDIELPSIDEILKLYDKEK